MSKFVMAGEDEILNGDVTDVYFDYTKEYLKNWIKTLWSPWRLQPHRQGMII